MNLIETYALNCGAKIDKPYIYSTFFPIPFERYITFHTDEAEQSKSYEYWQDVINIITPVLKNNNITIVQVGDANNREMHDCVSFRGQTSLNQLAYIMERSMLHVGPDGFLLHLASYYDIPIVGLYSPYFIECNKPFFGSASKHILLSSYDRAKQKPSYSPEENPKTINLLLPEEIASSVLKLLNINFDFPFDTVFIGKKYSGFNIQESIPNNPTILFNPENPVEIRTDLEYDDGSLHNQLAHYKKSIVIISKTINFDILRRFKDNIHSIVVRILGGDQKELISKIVELGKNIILVSPLPEEEIQKLKHIYYEFGNIHPQESIGIDKINELKKDSSYLYYRSSKITAVNGKYYYSQAAAEVGIPMDNPHEYQKVIDSQLFWDNAHCFMIVKKK